MDESIRIILEAVQKGQAEIAKALQAINGITAATKRQQTAFAAAQAIITQHRRSLLALGGAATAVASAFGVFARGQIKLGDTLNALTQKTGISVENLSTLAKSAKNASVDFGQLAVGLKFLNKSIVESQKAGSEDARAFEALGVSVKDANGNVKDTHTILLEVSDAFRNAEDDAGKVTVAMTLFGRSGEAIIPALNEDIRKNQAAIRALGGEMSGKFAKDADAFTDQINNLGTVLGGAAKAVLVKMLPTLQKLAEFLIQNKEIVATTFTAITAAVVTASVAFASFKAFTLIAGFVKILGLLGPMISGMGLLGTSATAAGVAAAGAAPAFVVVGAAIASLTAILYTGVEAWRAYKASQEEAAAVKGLEETTATIRDRLKLLVEDLRKSNKITAEEAARIAGTLDKVAASGDIELQLRANKAVIAAIKDKVDAENRFAVAAKASAEAAKTTTEEAKKQKIVVAKSPEELAKERQDRIEALQAKAAPVRAEAEAKGLDLERAQAEADARTSIFRNAEADILAEKQFALDAQSASQKAALAELDAEDLVDRQLHEQKKNNILKQGEIDRLAIAKKAVDADKALQQTRLEAGREIFSGLAEIAESFGKKGFIAAKAFAIASAVINTILAVTAALAQVPYPLNFVAAGVVAALGAVQVAKIAGVGFAEGGLVPGAPSSKDNRLAAVATGEYIFDSGTVAKAGPAFFARLHAAIRDGSFVSGFARGGIVPRPSVSAGFAEGGLVGAAQSGNAPTETNVKFGFVDTRNQEREFMRKEGVGFLIDMMQRRGNKVYA